MGMPARRRALRRALRENPCSLRRLAMEANVSHANLRAAAEGRRNVSDGMAKAVASALRRWAVTCNRLASDLETASTAGGDDG